MEIPANRARIEFALEGTPYPVIAVSGEERLNQGFHFQIDIQIALHQLVDAFVGRRCLLRMAGGDGDQRRVAGRVTFAEDVGFDPGGTKRIVLGFMPSFRVLEQVRGPALWLGLDFKGLIKTLLDESGLPHAGELRFDFSSSHPARPWTLRVPEETSAELIQRRMAHEGIFFRIDQAEGHEQLIFSDHNTHCPYVSGGAVRKLAEAGMVDVESGQAQTGVFRISHHSVAQPGAARGYVLPDAHRVRPQASDPRASQRPGSEHWFGGGLDTLPSAQAWATLRDRYNDQQAEYLTILANRVDLAAGHCITLEAGPQPGDYLIMAVKHHSAQASGLNVAGPTVAYSCEATLVPRARPYVTAFPLKRRLPPLIGARIESDSAYASLDELGRYRLRTLFEPGINPHARASVPIRKQSPHGGPPGKHGKPVGWHAPLQEGAEVMLSCLNHDPEQLMIAGGLYNPGQKSPVLGKNLTQNIYRTAGANALIMDDKKAKELIKLQALDGLLCLELNADKVGHWVGLTTTEGAMALSAKKTQLLKSGDTLTERTENDRIQQVENRHLTKTNQGEIHQQSARDTSIRAGESVKIISGKDTRILAGKNIRLNVKNNAKFTIQSGDALMHVNNGHVHFQGARSIRVRGKGGGPITFEQGGAGFRIREDGTVDLFGKTVSLGGPNGVNFSGPVNYEVPGAAEAPKPNICKAIQCEAPIPLEDNGISLDPITDLVYVAQCDDPAIGDGKLLLLDPEQSRELTKEEQHWSKLMQDLQLAIEQEDKARIERAKEEIAKDLIDHVKVSKKSHSFTEIRRLAGKKFTYVRSDKLKNHRRSYSLRVDDRDRSLFKTKERKDGTTYRTLNKKTLKERFETNIIPKLTGEITLYETQKKNLLSLINKGWEEYIEEVNSSLHGAAQQEGVPTDEIQWHRGWDAQLFRYYTGANIKWKLRPDEGTLNIGANAQSQLTLAQARGLFTAYWPHISGHNLIIDMPLKQGGTKNVNLGAIRGKLICEITGFTGASALGSLSVNIELDETYNRLKFKGADKAKDKKRKKSPGGASLSGRLFAGAEAGGDIKGDIEWQNPEVDFAWKSFLSVGVGLDGSAGIGIEGDFTIKYEPDKGKFMFRAKAGIALGLGASGEIGGEISAMQMVEFVQFVFHQLNNENFDYLGFIEEKSFEVLSTICYWHVRTGQELAKFIDKSLDDVKEWAEKEMEHAADAEDLARRVLDHSHDMLRFLTPEAKGVLLYHLTETFWLSESGTFWMSREELQENATLKILSLVQTRKEFHEVCEHITEDGSKSVRDDPYQAGFERLEALFDFSQYIRFLQLQHEWRSEEKREKLEEMKARKDKRLSFIKRLETYYPGTPRHFAAIQETFDPNCLA